MLRLLSWSLIILVPATVIFALTFPHYWEIVLVNLVFYSKILFKLAKAEIVLFISKMTVFKLILLTLKRFVMDNIISRAIADHFTVHITPELKKWWKNLDVKGMVLWFAPVSLVTLISTWLAGIAKTTLFVFIKALIAGTFKLLWLVLAKIYLFLTNSILAQLAELLAVSYLLEKVSNTSLFQKRLKPALGRLVERCRSVVSFIDKKLHQPINNKVDQLGKQAAAKIRAVRKQQQAQRAKTDSADSAKKTTTEEK